MVNSRVGSPLQGKAKGPRPTGYSEDRYKNPQASNPVTHISRVFVNIALRGSFQNAPVGLFI